MVNVFKNLVAFLLMYKATDWIAAKGWVEVYMIMFMLSMLGIIFAALFYILRRK